MDGWGFHWLTSSTILRVFVADNGHITTALWDRPYFETYARDFGYMDLDAVDFYRQYDRNMPEDIAAQYFGAVLSLMYQDDFD